MSLATIFLLSTTLPSAADPGHTRPKITTFEFSHPPLKAGINETLKVTAHDPDSWIDEVQVKWEDAEQNGGVVFAHTFCVQDPDHSDPGTPAKLKIPMFFDEPGRYRVEVRALSAIRCEQGNQDQQSKTLEMDVVVRDPLTTATDPDDVSGPLDVASITQTQESSETSASNEIVHRVTMFDAWENEALAGPAYAEMYFDLDGDPSTNERVLTLDLDEESSSLRASMVDAQTGQGRGYASVKRPDDKTVEITFPPLLLKKGLRSYRWFFQVDGAGELCSPEDPCIDRAPDANAMRHRL